MRREDGGRHWPFKLGVLALAFPLAVTGCSGGAPDSGEEGPLATRVAQLEQRIKRLEQIAQTPGARLTPEPLEPAGSGTATPTPRPTPPIPLATLAAKVATGGATLVKEWQGNRPRRLDSFLATAPWVIFWTLNAADARTPFKVQVYRVGESQPFTTPIEAGTADQGQAFMFEGGSFLLETSGAGDWQLRVATIQ